MAVLQTPVWNQQTNLQAGRAGDGTMSPYTASCYPGDLEFLFTWADNGTHAITANGGTAWSALTGSPFSGPGSEKMYVWWRINGAADSQPTVTVSGSTPTTSSHMCGCQTFAGGTFDPAAPFDVIGTSANGNAGTATFNGLTGTTANDLAVVLVGVGINTNVGTVTQTGQSYTEVWDAGTTAGDDSRLAVVVSKISSGGNLSNGSIQLGLTAPYITVPIALKSYSLSGTSYASWEAAVTALAPRNWYKFNETSGTTLVDYGSTPTNGAYNGTVTLGLPTVIAGSTDTVHGAASLNSSEATAAVTIPSTFTLCQWIDDCTNTGAIFWRDNTTSGGTIPFWLSTTFQARVAGATFNTSIPAASVADGNKHFFVLQRLNGVVLGNCRLWLDGVPVAVNYMASAPAASSPQHFGRNGPSGTFANITEDDALIFDRSLSATEVATLWDLGAAPPGGQLLLPLLDENAQTLTIPEVTSPITKVYSSGAEAGVVDAPITTGVVGGGLGGGTVTIQSSVKWEGNNAYFMPTGSNGWLRSFGGGSGNWVGQSSLKRNTLRFRARIESLPSSSFTLIQSWGTTSGLWVGRGGVSINTDGTFQSGATPTVFVATPGVWFEIQLMFGDPSDSNRTVAKVGPPGGPYEALPTTNFTSTASIGIGHPSSTSAPDLYIDAIDYGWTEGPAGNWFGTSLYLPTLDAGTTVYEPIITDYEPNDPGTVDDPITGTVYISSQTVRSIDEVDLYISHPNTSHLLVTLKPPDGSPEVTLFDHRGTGANIGASSAAPLKLRDDAASAITSFVSGTGQTLRPEQPLSTFRNEGGGIWTITVTDTTTSTVVELPYALIYSSGPKGQKKVLKPKLATYNPTLFAPALVSPGSPQTVTMPLLTVTPTLFAPTLPGKLVTPLLTVTPTFFGPAVVGSYTLTTPLLTVNPTLFVPTIRSSSILTVPLLMVNPSFFGPAVNPGAVNVDLPLLTVDPGMYAPGIHLRVVLPLLSVDPVLYQPTVIPLGVKVELPLLDANTSLFAAVVHQRVVLVLLDLDTLTLEPRLIVPKVYRVFPPSRPGTEYPNSRPGRIREVD